MENQAYLHSGFPAHKSGILLQPIETVFKSDNVQIFPGKRGTHIIIPDIVS
jgi:hypothetical protein